VTDELSPRLNYLNVLPFDSYNARRLTSQPKRQ
jgi:hypothetical protein